jgi:cold shock CspA family protein/ribosome-associated translation inhibitor RaiA
MDPSPAVEAQIHAKVKTLERFFGRIIGCEVVIEQLSQHSRKGNPFGVRLELSVPAGPPIVVSQPHHDRPDHDDAYIAIRDAFNAAKRQLQDRARKIRGEVKRHAEPNLGHIWHLVPAERYGFILANEDRTEIYFHENALVAGEYDDLVVGDEVTYVVHPKEGIKGPQASTVKFVRHASA